VLSSAIKVAYFWVLLHTTGGTKLYATNDAGSSWRSLVTATR
jgi:hypothetical protein